MIGLVVGVISGTIQFLLLKRFTALATGAGIDIKCVLLGLSQLLLPFAVLAGIAFLRRQDIIWTGVGISVSLMIGALAAVVSRLRKKGR